MSVPADATLGKVEDSPSVLSESASESYSGEGGGDALTTELRYNKVGHAPPPDMPRILLMGLRRSGKSSIQQVVFHKLSCHETLFLESTSKIVIKEIHNNQFIRFQIWDFPGKYEYNDPNAEEKIFVNTSTIIFVIDAQDEPYTEAIANLVDTIARAVKFNSSINFEIFLHKVDGDLFSTYDSKSDCQSQIQYYVTHELRDAGIRASTNTYLTSIYDHSIFEAFSAVTQKLIPQAGFITSLIDMLNASCRFSKSVLCDVVSKLCVASDSNPMDTSQYELFSDMIDVVIDVSSIYGREPNREELFSFDGKSFTMIKLSHNTYMYLRSVGPFLALVSTTEMQEQLSSRTGIIDYNFSKFQEALKRVGRSGRSSSRPQLVVQEPIDSDPSSM